ncbi:MAG: 4Fe-4S dicluster domain-containing protein [Candidatus Brocadiae bacterium]|nr:4Fe-4S dicluster domain-containing protein [Candidatus Brocadiia bacterium]
MSDLVRDASEAELLARTAAVCSECGACTLVCPTCHCFLLYDQLVADDQIERVRSLDSCLYASYSRMAGAGGMKPTPRPDLRSRFLNRLLHKFVWLPQSAGLLGCVGCGRCIEADMGGLDLRQFIHQLEA